MDIPFKQAKNFTKGRKGKIDLIVIHDMEMPEKPDTAELVAAYFSSPGSPKASFHYAIDSNSIIQCVKDEDTAWHAPGASHNGIGIEHAGYARQTEEQWNDQYSKAMLELSANLTANLCIKYGIPVKFVDAAGLLVGQRGITTHAEVSKAFKKSNHTDPGRNFPIVAYIVMVESYIAIPAESP